MKEENNNCPTKKRKSIDERTATTNDAHDDGGSFLSSSFGRGGDGASSELQSIQQTLSQMNKIMMRMEEKLATVGSTMSSLESRCEQLERKCSSIENNVLESTKEHMDRKFDSLSFDLEQKCDSLAKRLEAKVDSALAQETEKALKRHEYNDMLRENQRWEYSPPVLPMDELIHNGYTEDEAELLDTSARDLKRITSAMRRGEFSNGTGNKKGVFLEMNDDGPPFNYTVNKVLLPHWKEFANALKQLTPVMNLLPDNVESYFTLSFVQLNHDAMLLIKEALIGKPFRNLSFMNNSNGDADGAWGGMTAHAILDIVESNKHLRKLCIERNQIGYQHIERLCSTVCNYPLMQLSLPKSFVGRIGDQMLTALLTSGELKLESLDMSGNNITSAVSTILSDFLASNPTLKELCLADNNLDDSDAELIANALRTNTTLRDLDLEDNDITDDGSEAFQLVLCDESSLNAAFDSNHFCHWHYDEHNSHEQWQTNRASKVYRLLSSRNGTLSNVTHFGDIDVKILPNMLEVVQKYHDAAIMYNLDIEFRISYVEPLSIMYEMMRKWDKAFHLYKSLGKYVKS